MSYTNGLDDPSAFFQIQIWDGNGSTNAITFDGNSDMQPDMVWIKIRVGSNSGVIHDSVRGTTKRIETANTGAESTVSSFSSFDTDGFTLSGNDGYVNTNDDSNTYCAWSWKKQAGVFDIQTYTGNGSARTISHNLGAVPKMMIIKKRNTTAPWSVGHASLGANQILELNETDAVATDASYWNNTRPTSSVFTVGTDGNQNTDGHTYVIYLFGNKQGVSKCGSYVGNGSTNGSTIFCGFKPAFVMVKKSSATNNWVMQDTKRNPHNMMTEFLMANVADAESTGLNFDFLSNGFKLRSASGGTNTSGATYIYIAFAENPFVTSTGVPATAR